jgi:hypothetical protein
VSARERIETDPARKMQARISGDVVALDRAGVEANDL